MMQRAHGCSHVPLPLPGRHRRHLTWEMNVSMDKNKNIVHMAIQTSLLLYRFKYHCQTKQEHEHLCYYQVTVVQITKQTYEINRMMSCCNTLCSLLPKKQFTVFLLYPFRWHQSRTSRAFPKWNKCCATPAEHKSAPGFVAGLPSSTLHFIAPPSVPEVIYT